MANHLTPTTTPRPPTQLPLLLLPTSATSVSFSRSKISVPVTLLLLLFFFCGTTESTNGTQRNLLQSSDGSRLSVAAQFLQPQNAIRAGVGDPPLRWSKKLARYARWWANVRKADCALRHSNGPYGENIFWGSGKAWQPSEAVAAWVEENKWYNYRRNSCNGFQECGHYTQIVWKSSTAVGCARVVCYNSDVFMTCNYYPPGNYIGQRPY